MTFSTRIQAGIYGALIALSTAGAANASPTVDNRRYESIGFSAAIMCSIWQGDISKHDGVRLMSNQIHNDDMDFFNDKRVAFIIRGIATDIAKNEVDCDVQDEVSFAQRNIPWLFKARDIMQSY
jgi:hypothetical protein